MVKNVHLRWKINVDYLRYRMKVRVNLLGMLDWPWLATTQPHLKGGDLFMRNPSGTGLLMGFTSVLLHMLIASTVRCVENMDLRRSNFWAILNPKWFSRTFCTGFIQSWLTCEFELLLELSCISASEVPFQVHFRPQNRTWFRFLVIFANILH